MQWDADRRKWVVRWREAGKQRVKRFDRRGDAELFEATLRRRRQLGDLATERLGGEVTLGEWVVTRWAPEHQSHLAPNTRRWHAELWGPHLAELEGVRLKDLTPGTIRAWQASRDHAGAGRTALRRALQLLGAILQHAVESDELPANPVRAVKPLPLRAKQAVRALSPREVELIRQQMSRPLDRLIVSAMAYGGLRPGEFLALEGERVLERVLVVDLATDGAGGVKETKTGATRAVRLLQPLADDLREVAPAHGRIVPGRTWDRGLWANWRSRVWRPAIEAALGFYQRPYDLRHSFASLLLAEGHTIHYVAAQMGHDAAETLSRYGHLIAEFEGSKVDANEAIYAARVLVWGAQETPVNPPI